MARLLAGLYSVFCYAIGMLSIVYLIGFVGNLLVPKGIDSGEVGGTVESLTINLLLMALFAIQHAVMARPRFKAWWTRVVPSPIERSTYLLFSSAVTVLFVCQWRPLPGVVWSVENPTGVAVLLALFGLGWVILVGSSFMINHFELFGLSQAFYHLTGKTPPAAPFRQRLLYKYVRHPIMVGWLLGFWSAPVMSVGRLEFTLFMTLYIVGSVKFLEERDLVSYFGAAYQRYQREVPMLIPWFRRG